MKRFLVFAGEPYHPAGGWHDFLGAFDTIEEAEASIPADVLVKHEDIYYWDWAHLVDLETGQIIKGFGNDWGTKRPCSDWIQHYMRKEGE